MVSSCRKRELDWTYEQGGAEMIFPEEWERYKAQIPDAKRGEMIRAYHALLTGDNEARRLQAALAWSRWEAATSKLVDDGSLTAKFEDPHLALAFARIECHYFMNGAFMPDDDYLLREAVNLRIPTRIVQGRYDMVCPIASAWELKKTMGIADDDFRVVLAGHNALESAILDELIQATNDFKRC